MVTNSIESFTVVQPPTSGEVETAAFEALKTGGFLSLVILGDQEIPRPVEQNINFRIRSTSHPEDGGMRVEGKTELNADFIVTSLSVDIDNDPSLPAIGSLVSTAYTV
jgi:hypothetical protein